MKTKVPLPGEKWKKSGVRGGFYQFYPPIQIVLLEDRSYFTYFQDDHNRLHGSRDALLAYWELSNEN